MAVSSTVSICAHSLCNMDISIICLTESSSDLLGAATHTTHVASQGLKSNTTIMPCSSLGTKETDITQKDEKQSKNEQNRARNGKV
ncbi:hypothetical protein Tco_0901892 [Tanacetum coccineum]